MSYNGAGITAFWVGGQGISTIVFFSSSSGGVFFFFSSSGQPTNDTTMCAKGDRVARGFFCPWDRH
jgi:hypothetical protein